jgi:hypothetical protein
MPVVVPFPSQQHPPRYIRIDQGTAREPGFYIAYPAHLHFSPLRRCVMRWLLGWRFVDQVEFPDRAPHGG